MFLRDSGEAWVKDSQKKPMRRACMVAKIKLWFAKTPSGFKINKIR